MDKKRLSVNLVANLLSYGVATVLSFCLTPYLVRNLGKEVYGFYGIANSFVSYITVISIALNSMASKYITVELVKGNKERAKQYYTSIFFSNIVLCLILTPILVIVVLNLSRLLSISEYYVVDVQILFALIFAAMLLRFITSIYGCSTYASNRMDLRAYTEMAKSLLRLGLYLILFTVFKPSIIYLGIVLFLLELFNSAVQIVLAVKLTPELKIKKIYNSVSLVKSTLKVGIWNSVNQLGDLLLSSSDLVVSNVLLGEIASGNISIIKTMPSLISGVITAINGVFMPRVAHRYAENDTAKLVDEVKNSQRIMGAMVTPIVLLLIVFGYDFYNLWVPGNDIHLLMTLSGLDIVRMLIIGVTWPVANLNIVMDKVKLPSILVIVTGILNILSMIVLVGYTDIGIYSIVVTTLVLTSLFYGIFIPIYPCKELKISWRTFYGAVFRMLIVSILTVILIKPIHSMVSVDNWIDFFFYGGICAIIAFLVSATIFIGPQKIRTIIIETRNK